MVSMGWIIVLIDVRLNRVPLHSGKTLCHADLGVHKAMGNSKSVSVSGKLPQKVLDCENSGSSDLIYQ